MNILNRITSKVDAYRTVYKVETRHFYDKDEKVCYGTFSWDYYKKSKRSPWISSYDSSVRKIFKTTYKNYKKCAVKMGAVYSAKIGKYVFYDKSKCDEFIEYMYINIFSIKEE